MREDVHIKTKKELRVVAGKIWEENRREKENDDADSKCH
mgnify:CR=1 FL=1